MIAFLRGILVERLPHRVCIDVGGVGYEVSIPISCYDDLPLEGQEVKLLTHHHVREQEETLYGFLHESERDLFRLLTQQVSGIGPAKCMSIIGGMGVDGFKSATVSGDTVALASVKGIGKKTAERIVFELKDKVGVAEAWQNASASGPSTPEASAKNDAVLALIALGYTQSIALRALGDVEKSGKVEDAATTDDFLRAALRQLN